MPTPLFERSELRPIARKLGALLVLFGGVALLLQAYLVDLLPPRGGFIETSATVMSLERTGTFQDPAFLITLAYDVSDDNGTIQEFRSGRRVEFEQYFELSEGAIVDISYNPRDPYEWRFADRNDKLSEYGLGVLMIIFGAFSLSFPALINWASRQEDFEFTDELDDSKSPGADIHHYDNSSEAT